MKKYSYILAAALGLSVMTGCEERLEVAPTTQVEADIAVTDFNSLDKAALGAYSAVQSSDYYGYRYAFYNEVYSDNMEFIGTFTTDREATNRNFTASNLQINNTWSAIYVVINRANTVITQAERLFTAGTITAEQRDAIQGEMYFLRGLAYFDLVKVFGGVPLELNATTGLPDIQFLPRSSEQDVYNSIISDLTNAENMLGTTESSDPRRASGLAASALLARVYLQNGNYAQAQAKASQVIESGAFELMPTFASIFTTEGSGNRESIFEVDFTTNDQNSLGSATNPNTPGQKFYVRQGTYEALQASAANGDTRFQATVRVEGSANRRRLLKYEDAVNNADNVIVIRLAEMYLIRAEAAVRQTANGGDNILPVLPTVLADINAIRSRAGLPRLLALTNRAALDEILRQRRLEFVGEGLRFIDLRRYNQTCSVLGFCDAQAFRNLWPIPLQQIERNPNLDKNEGY
ncbi:RagB/SusD family nutrient uptake outer membrane protein [Pontibacter ramchanderi]|uniref:SusD-like starch-binding protein associating with outer membrane n=1 Tax=Pontibacter ramchanderi TaxID=1179743 RepID=A0A2N3U8V8_9BACT|nr:RagB/SusD family nutrient uptake outer membrane protein [Pontibacter ramchanderi]PKV63187.1 SusD-like starch-binding protein associating with outer membrane [Pontibacter ramchanderi]